MEQIEFPKFTQQLWNVWHRLLIKLINLLYLLFLIVELNICISSMLFSSKLNIHSMYTYVWYIVPEHWRMISWTKRIYALLSQKGKSYDMLNSIHFIGCNFALIPLAWREKEAIYLKWRQKLWEIQFFTVTISVPLLTTTYSVHLIISHQNTIRGINHRKSICYGCCIMNMVMINIYISILNGK